MALLVFLENRGTISGVSLPPWAMAVVDFVAEEYVKSVLRLHGVYRRYDRVLILEDARATGKELRAALVSLSGAFVLDVLVLAHGGPDSIIGYGGEEITARTFASLIALAQANPGLLNLRAVWQMNCHGVTMLQTWRALGARSVSGTPGVNWLPEPALSLFLRRWLRGEPFSLAVKQSGRAAEQLWQRVYGRPSGRTHPNLESSRPIVYGVESDFFSDRG